MQKFLFHKEAVLGDIRSPVYINPETLFRCAAKSETLEKVVSVCMSLSADEFTTTMVEAYRKGISNFGDSWGYVDITSLLYSVAELGQPENYLEIGVRRGRSACMVASASPDTTIYAFDMWQENYAANDNLGPDFVKSELQKIGHAGRIEFVSGDSHQTLPKFFSENPGLSFDLITVDGDHSLEGAWADLCDVVGKLRIGGVIVFDDIDNPYCPGLIDVWDRFLKAYPELHGMTVYNPLGLGVAFAIKMRDAKFVKPKPEKKGISSWLKF
ncbi:MAG: class I SAM-dependent methyltransferase [Arenimonas sp.]